MPSKPMWCNYTKYVMVLWTSAWVLSEKVISLNIQGTCPMELQLVILDVPFFSYIIVILWVIVLWKWWIIWPKYKKTSSLIKKCLFLCFWADYLHYLIRLLFFCCPEPRMLKWLYAGNAFDEWTYAPCSAALYNVDSLANTYLLYAKSEGARSFVCPVMKPQVAGWCFQGHGSVCCVNNHACRFNICGRSWNGWHQMNFCYRHNRTAAQREHKWLLILWESCRG